MGEFELSIAAARPGVLVSAPVNSPTINLLSIPRKYDARKANNDPETTTVAAIMIN